MMAGLGLEREIVNNDNYKRTVARLKERHVRLPTLSQLAKPSTIPAQVIESLQTVDADVSDPHNLFRVHWYNDESRSHQAAVPAYVTLPPSLTGVPCNILVALGNRFPMIRAHKVLAAYGCLIPRLVTGQFDASRHRAIWPSTGNYCRGGVAISSVLGCRGVAVLPQGMSDERFNWLAKWVIDASDVIRTVGTESNVKEIYDKCNELEKDPGNLIFNQFCEFGNHLVHYTCTGPALEHIFSDHAKGKASRLAAFVSATGSAGTIAAGDYLKDHHGTAIVAAEALECPTMLYNGFGEHNIQGIGDKHIPYIHNVMNTDVVVGISDRSTDSLFVLFNTETGREFLSNELGVATELLDAMTNFGLSSFCNVLAAIKTARLLGLGADDVIVTVATDGGELYASEVDKAVNKYFGGTFNSTAAAASYGEHLAGTGVDHALQLAEVDKNRIFNLGYFTWVEQQGVSVAEFEARRSQHYWRGLRELVPIWDAMIEDVNRATGAV